MSGLADQHALGLAARKLQDFGRHQVVVEDDVGRPQGAHGSEREQLRIARPSTNEPDMA